MIFSLIGLGYEKNSGPEFHIHAYCYKHGSRFVWNEVIAVVNSLSHKAKQASPGELINSVINMRIVKGFSLLSENSILIYVSQS